MLKLVHQNTSGSLPTSTYIFFDEDKEVGFIQIRHQPSHSKEVPSDFASHIYYEIYPQYRGQGYGKEILKFGLREVRGLGLNEIYITCFENNIASRKIIEGAGGILTDSCEIPNSNIELPEKFLKYKLKI